MLRIARLSLVTALLAPWLHCQTPSQIDDIFQAWDKPSTPGAGLAIIQHGKIIYEKGYGSANLEYDIPITPQTIFHVASVSKQFTAMAIVLLEQDGKLSIDDDVHKYLPELPDYHEKITLRNLLQHTSGIRDQWQILALAGWSLEDVITQDQILRMLFRQTKLNFPPGTQHLYSNSGFTLLAEIVKRVSGKPLPDFCAERIFRPLGMTRTHFHQDLHKIVHGRAYSYSTDGHGFEAAPLNYANVGATSLFTTAGDLVKWLDNFREPKVGGPTAVARLQEQCVLLNGRKIDYGLGVEIGKYRGLSMIAHSGADAGYRSRVIWFPDDELGIAVVSNLGNFNPTAAANKVAALYLHDKMGPEPPATLNAAPLIRSFITVEPAALKKYAGIYPLPGIGQTLTVEVADGKLWSISPGRPRMELKAVTPDHFYIEQLSEEIGFTARPQDGMSIKFARLGVVAMGDRVAPLTPKALAQYTGTYWSEELEAQYTIMVREGNLVAMNAHHGEFKLTQYTPDHFLSNMFFFHEVGFVRGEAGKVTGLTVGGGRVTEVDFARK